MGIRHVGSRARRVGRATCALLVLAPGGALGCGLCFDAAWRRETWLASAPLALVMALGAEALLFAVWGLVRRRRPGYPRLRAHLVGLAAAVAASLLTGGSGLGMAVPFAAALLYSFVRSTLAERALGPRVLVLRLALVGALLAFGLLRSHPTRVPTERLVGLCVLAPHAWGLEPGNWVERELRGRPGALAEIERRLNLERDAERPLPTRAEMALLRLHFALGGPAGARAARCEGWDLVRYERNYGGASPPALIARTVCARSPD